MSSLCGKSSSAWIWWASGDLSNTQRARSRWETQIDGTLVYPKDLDETKSYPVIDFIYASPQDFYTAKAFRPSTDFRVLANKGYIVVRSDGMGTN